MLTARASASFTVVPTLGFVRACSIWMIMPRLTPERAARASRVKPRSPRQRLRLRASDCVSWSRSVMVHPIYSMTQSNALHYGVLNHTVHHTVLRGSA